LLLFGAPGITETTLNLYIEQAYRLGRLKTNDQFQLRSTSVTVLVQAFVKLELDLIRIRHTG